MGIQVTRVDCKLPNVCAIDVKADESLRIIGVYASDSRSWSWEEISPLIASKCVVFGDFNVDVFQDSNKSEKLLRWADMNSLAPFIPDAPTSLRSNRVIDYALARGININVQTQKGNTTSDHLPILSSIPISIKQNLVEAWLRNRRAFIEVNGSKSRWFNIGKGGPQGGILTPCLFIAYHCDMGQFLSGCTSHFFADDLAAIVSGQIGLSYTNQCLDLE
ncbi:unnamed protein product, partial [Rotaria sp. Silwood2]